MSMPVDAPLPSNGSYARLLWCVEAATTREPDEHRGDRIVAHVGLTVQGSVKRPRAYARAELPPNMPPATYAALERIPRQASRKHDIETLRAGPAC
jgi:hypothetical protein